MDEISLSEAQKALIVEKIQHYFEQERDEEIGRFDAEFLLDFFTKEIGPFFYNSGLYDAKAMVDKKIEYLGEAIYELEKPTL